MFSRILYGVLASLLLFSLNTNVSAQEQYMLNAGDVLDISVWNEETLQKQVIILPDGMISFPLAGQLLASGKSVTQVQAALSKKLAEFLSEPVVTVSVVNVIGNTVHIMGKVNTPGSFVMSQRLDAMQALSLAGGLSAYAEENNIIVVRREGTKQQTYPIRYAQIKKGRGLETNIMLKSGDVLIVP